LYSGRIITRLHCQNYDTIIQTFNQNEKVKNKLKTRKAAAKRYKKTKTGKILRKKAFRGHILEKKSPKRKRNLRQTGLVSKGEIKPILLMLPN
jgi:large subunit ribosomal protein L35